MNYLDIILWASAIGLWVWVIVHCVEWVLKKHDQSDATRRSLSDLINEHRRIVSNYFELKNRLDAIEAKLEKGKR